MLAGELNNLVEYARDAQQPRAISRREPVNETAQPLRAIGMAPDAGGPDMPIACSMPMALVRPRTT